MLRNVKIHYCDRCDRTLSEGEIHFSEQRHRGSDYCSSCSDDINACLPRMVEALVVAAICNGLGENASLLPPIRMVPWYER